MLHLPVILYCDWCYAEAESKQTERRGRRCAEAEQRVSPMFSGTKGTQAEVPGACLWVGNPQFGDVCGGVDREEKPGHWFCNSRKIIRTRWRRKGRMEWTEFKSSETEKFGGKLTSILQPEYKHWQRYQLPPISFSVVQVINYNCWKQIGICSHYSRGRRSKLNFWPQVLGKLVRMNRK